jgi:predicted DNA-binding transcriptional regulator YafY
MATKHDRQRITRQWTLLLLLIRHRFGLTLGRLREGVGVSRVTLWRDLRTLSEAGVPIEERVAGGEKKVVLRTSDLPALILSPLQIQALKLARRLLGPMEGTALLEAYDDILQRVGCDVPGARTAPDAPGADVATIRREVEDGLRRRVRLQISFLNVGESEPRMRTIEPIGWRFVRGELYLLAWDVERGAERSFASHRIRVVAALPENAERTPVDDDTGFFAPAEGLESLPEHDVVIDLSPIAAAHLVTRPLHASQRVEPRPNGGARLVARVPGLWFPADWVLSWGGEARPIAPGGLIDLVRERAQHTLDVLSAP